jgi:hypothetical protein
LPESKVRKAAAEKRKRTDASKAGAAAPVDKAKGSADKADGSARSTAASTASDRRTSRRASSPAREVRTATERRWLLPATIVLAVLGLAWGIFYFAKPDLIPFMAGLGKWNILIAVAAIVIAAVVYLALRPRTSTPYAPGSRRWVPPTFITVGLLGVAWLIVYYVGGQSIPFMAMLGNWNILIGMGGMAAAFVIATLWK